MKSFRELGLCAPLQQSLREEGYETPTPIQLQAIPPVMAGRDVLGCAQTGTGKTAAFALPILHRLLESGPTKSARGGGGALPRVLVLSPTRELATQIAESFSVYGRHTGMRQAVIFGGVSQHHQVKALQRGVDVLVATPGRLIDLMDQRLADLSQVTVFVLDEADRMLDMGFIQPIRRIAAAVPRPPARQTLLFSATMPDEIRRLADSLMHDPVRVAVTPIASTVPKIEQSAYAVPKADKPALLRHLLADESVLRAVVFTRTKHGADRVSRMLARNGVSADAIHGNKAQNQRTRALDRFRSGAARVLVATDVAARGLDVDGITHVFNFDLPMEPEAYVHRIGRTARAGASGSAVSFCDPAERPLLRQVERLIGRSVPMTVTPKELPAEVLVERGRHGEHADAERGDSRRAGSRNGRQGERREASRSGGPGRDRAHDGGFQRDSRDGGGFGRDSSGRKRGGRSGPRRDGRSHGHPAGKGSSRHAEHAAPRTERSENTRSDTVPATTSERPAPTPFPRHGRKPLARGRR
ncbi:MAG: DEAD/DEAH box helicase [Planctomycetia bacterium]|nr:MAG: DEAD/DEAH box helicase [Planctomycetia bacterium]